MVVIALRRRLRCASRDVQGLSAMRVWKEFDGPTIVVTQYLPAIPSIDSRHKTNDPVRAAESGADCASRSVDWPPGRAF